MPSVGMLTFSNFDPMSRAQNTLKVALSSCMVRMYLALFAARVCPTSPVMFKSSIISTPILRTLNSILFITARLFFDCWFSCVDSSSSVVDGVPHNSSSVKSNSCWFLICNCSSNTLMSNGRKSLPRRLRPMAGRSQYSDCNETLHRLALLTVWIVDR